MPAEKWSMHLTCSPRETFTQLLLLMGIWHMLPLHLLLCCYSGTYCCSHIICFWSASNICQKPKDTCRIFCSEMEANTFSSPWKTHPCTRITKYHSPCYHEQILLGRPLVSDWTGIKALLTAAFPLILVASEWGPIKDIGMSSNSLWWITKAFPSSCHHSHALASESGDQPRENKKGERWKSTGW